MARNISIPYGVIPTLILAALGSGLFAFPAPSQEAGPAAGRADSADTSRLAPSTAGNVPEAIAALTDRLRGAARKYHAARADRKQALVARMVKISRHRKELIESVLEERPELLLAHALPAGFRDRLPREITRHLEEEVAIDGYLEAEVSDGLGGSGEFAEELASYSYRLETSGGKVYSLHFAGDGPGMLSGQPLHVRGVRLGDRIAVSDAGDPTLGELRGPGDRTASGAGSMADAGGGAYAQALSSTSTRKVAVVLFNFLNSPTQPYSVDHARNVVFTGAAYLNYASANAYYEEVSFGQLGFAGAMRGDGDIFGWYTIASDSTTCSHHTWATAAEAAAAADGFVRSNYQHIVYAFPWTGACAWAGRATLGGSPGRIWVNGSFSVKVLGHEIGHNLGADHANTYTCYGSSGQRVAISDNCTSMEYGDPFDIMGNTSINHMNVFHKGRLRWWQTANTIDVTADGEFFLEPLEGPSSGVQVLRIPRDFDARTGNVTRYYYLEYRRPFGFDNFSASAPVVNGVSIRLAPGYSSLARSQLLDATPATSGFYDAALAAGQTLEDPARGITLITTGVSTAGATVRVSFGPVVCRSQNPALSISPPERWSRSGGTVSFDVTVSNNDGAACAASTLSIAPTLPAGWVQVPASLAETLLPGARVTRRVELLAAPEAEEGAYTITQTATSVSHPELSAAASAVHRIDLTAPAVAIVSPPDGATFSRRGTVTISARASDPSGIARMELLVDGVSLKVCASSTSCDASWNLRRAPQGLHEITALVLDGASNEAAHSITVTTR